MEAKGIQLRPRVCLFKQKKGEEYQRDFVNWNRSFWVLSQNNFIFTKKFKKYCKDKIVSKCNISKNLYIYFEKQVAFLG